MITQPLVDTDDMPVAPNTAGMVIGHQGPWDLVELDTGETYLGTKRTVAAFPGSFRPAIAARSHRRDQHG